MTETTIYLPPDGSAPTYVEPPVSRRERIATAVLPFLMEKGRYPSDASARLAVGYADALIAELDKEAKR